MDQFVTLRKRVYTKELLDETVTGHAPQSNAESDISWPWKMNLILETR